MTEEDWDSGFGKSVAVYLNGQGIPGLDQRGQRVTGDSFVVCFNAHHEPIQFTLPPKEFGAQWQRGHRHREPRPTVTASRPWRPPRRCRWRRAHWWCCRRQASNPSADVRGSCSRHISDLPTHRGGDRLPFGKWRRCAIRTRVSRSPIPTPRSKLALRDVSIPALLLSCVHMAGPELLDGPLATLRPAGLFLNEVQGYMSEEDKAAARALALDIIRDYRDRGCPEPAPVDAGLLKRMMDWLVCEDVPRRVRADAARGDGTRRPRRTRNGLHVRRRGARRLPGGGDRVR